MPRIIFVCTGNICRSPMAEGLCRSALQRAGRDDILVSSMGIHGLENQPATEQSRMVCLRHGIDIAHHRSRPLVPSELKEADLVFTMEIVQRDFVKIFFPVAGDRVFMLAAWPHQEGKKHLIKDPMSRSDRVYQDVFTTIQRHVERVVPLLLSQVAS